MAPEKRPQIHFIVFFLVQLKRKLKKSPIGLFFYKVLKDSKVFKVFKVFKVSKGFKDLKLLTMRKRTQRLGFCSFTIPDKIDDEEGVGYATEDLSELEGEWVGILKTCKAGDCCKYTEQSATGNQTG